MRSSNCRRCGSSCAASAPSSSQMPLRASACASSATRAARACRADTGYTRPGATPSVCAVDSRCDSIWASTCAALAIGSSSVSILFSTTKRSSTGVLRYSPQIARSDRVTPASAAMMNTVACAAGSSPSVNSGSTPTAFKPGVSSTTRPRRSSGCGWLINACRQAGTSTMPAESGSALCCGCWSSQKPSARACAGSTRRVRATSSSDCAICAVSFGFNGRQCHAARRSRNSASEASSSRVWIGSRHSDGACAPSQASSTGHIVVRPGVAGSTRRPASAKNIALISSDLPRDTSATKATTSLSASTRLRTARNCSVPAGSINWCRVRWCDSSSKMRTTPVRQTLRASRLCASVGIMSVTSARRGYLIRSLSS